MLLPRFKRVAIAPATRPFVFSRIKRALAIGMLY